MLDRLLRLYCTTVGLIAAGYILATLHVLYNR